MSKVTNLQTSDFYNFIVGFITNSFTNSVAMRIVVQSLLPVVKMKYNERKRADVTEKMTAEEVIKNYLNCLIMLKITYLSFLVPIR